MQRVTFIAGLFALSLRAETITDHFVDIKDVSRNIRVRMMYFSDENFTGKRIPGYYENTCYLLPQVANSLAELQRELEQGGMGLEVRDCYRPKKSVSYFKSWMTNDKDHSLTMQDIFYPFYKTRMDLKIAKYFANNSAHSCGHAVDITIGDLSPIGTFKEWDMGGIVDFLDPSSKTDAIGKVGSREVSALHAEKRLILKTTMASGGFTNYWKEWWHYQYDQAFPGGRKTYTYQNIDIGAAIEGEQRRGSELVEDSQGVANEPAVQVVSSPRLDPRRATEVMPSSTVNFDSAPVALKPKIIAPTSQATAKVIKAQPKEKEVTPKPQAKEKYKAAKFNPKEKAKAAAPKPAEKTKPETKSTRR